MAVSTATVASSWLSSTFGCDVGINGRSRDVPKCFDILPFPSIKCRVHPGVIFAILDAYVRREQDQDYVIGSLMGIVNEGNIVEITDCFVDRHSLTDNGLLQIIKDHHESMYELKQKVNPKEDVVGWFCTGQENMTELTCAVHGWFKSFSSVSKFVQQPPLIEPIHLTVDTTLKDGHMGIKAFVQVPMLLVKDACFQFHQIPMEIYTTPGDKAGMSMLLKASKAEKELAAKNAADSRFSSLSPYEDDQLVDIPPLKDGFVASLDNLCDLLGKCAAYVDKVLENNDDTYEMKSIGRYMMSCLSNSSLIDKNKFDHLCQSSLQDTLMVAYLSSLARLQFAIAEKLNTSFF